MTYESDKQILNDISNRSEKVNDKQKKLEQIIMELGLTQYIGVLFDSRTEQLITEYLFYKNSPYKIFKKNLYWKQIVLSLQPVFEVKF